MRWTEKIVGIAEFVGFEKKNLQKQRGMWVWLSTLSSSSGVGFGWVFFTADGFVCWRVLIGGGGRSSVSLF